MAKKFEDMSEVDLAYKILNDAGKDNHIYYKDLILQILKLKNKSTQNEAAAISEVYTMINMDSRFQYNPEIKKWGLTEWDPPETKKRGVTRTKSQDKVDEMME
jgi:DNA-directed RNA polymerase subunit delta